MSHTTQCPRCQTRFKVSDAHLAVAEGMVRCGRCANVFNAREHFVGQPPAAAVTPPPIGQPRDPADDFELELPDFDPEAEQASPLEEEAPAAPVPLSVTPEPADPQTERDLATFQEALSEAMRPQPAVSPIGNPFAEDESVPAEPAAPKRARYRGLSAYEELAEEAAPTSQNAPDPVPSVEAPPAAPESEDTASDTPTGDAGAPDTEEAPVERTRRHPPVLTIVLGLLTLVGTLLLAGQLVYLNRTRIAAEVPELRPALERACAALGCEVPLPGDRELIRTEWSELSFVPEHANLIQVSATLKNHAPYPQAYPMLELSLKDGDDQLLIRKVFTPADYLRPDDFRAGKFAPGSEVKIAMRLKVKKGRALGYNLEWFYP
ncbi:zinc-ribbon domain/Protein of unknown function (DUF3426) [Gulbenkiania indica]|uniref:Zinc finger/thioredoxin putative domain-containing protein n=1 Tax=Gulbenkiania indica TaxID=375574 RepID=A0A0K6H333_9NEIS|nr:DUF3426 domain-containing protein [Gulbenkiania indica]CUA85231.1 zinc-ribbon domain/Protein of unknown function (DUF3426) [Gulbenkiania indica]